MNKRPLRGTPPDPPPPTLVFIPYKQSLRHRPWYSQSNDLWAAAMHANPLCDILSIGGCFTGPWTVTRSSLRMLRRVAAFCGTLRPVLLRVSFPRSRGPVVGVLGLCWMWHRVPFAHQRSPIVGVWRMCWLLPGLFDCFCWTPPPFGLNSLQTKPAPWVGYGREVLQEGGGGQRSGTQKVVHQKWPDQSFLIVNFMFSHDGHFGRGGGRGPGAIKQRMLCY